MDNTHNAKKHVSTETPIHIIILILILWACGQQLPGHIWYGHKSLHESIPLVEFYENDPITAPLISQSSQSTTLIAIVSWINRAQTIFTMSRIDGLKTFAVTHGNGTWRINITCIWDLWQTRTCVIWWQKLMNLTGWDFGHVCTTVT